jgi:glycosyltransferase involved in cell wall biosynthesis
MPRVSICLPVYNGENYLAVAIESVLCQTFEDFELLIADDCSSDKTPEIIQTYAERDNRIKHWVNPQNLKLFGNYNACIAKAEGEYIKLFAHDDLLDPILLDRMTKVLDENDDVSLVATARCWIDGAGKEINAQSALEKRTMKPFQTDVKLSAATAICDTMKEVVNWLGEPSSQMFRRKFAGKGYDLAFKQVGDLEYAYRLLEHGDYYFIADDLCYFRRHVESHSTAKTLDLAACMDWFLLASKYRKYLDMTNLSAAEYCLNVINALTRNLEAELNRVGKIAKEDRSSVLKDFLSGADPLSFFTLQDGERDLAGEFKAMSALSLLQSAISENEIRAIHDRVSGQKTVNSDSDNDTSIRQELKVALTSLEDTLREKDHEITVLREALDQMGNSVSWKVTEPLRKLKGKIGP